jgi:hypothetical protein
MKKFIFGAAALAVLALLSKKKDSDDNPTVTVAQKKSRTITFYKA